MQNLLFIVIKPYTDLEDCNDMARLAQSAERKALNLVVVGLSPTVGVCRFTGRGLPQTSLGKKGPAAERRKSQHERVVTRTVARKPAKSFQTRALGERGGPPPFPQGRLDLGS